MTRAKPALSARRGAAAPRRKGLKQELTRLRTALDAAADAFAIVDATTLRILDVNLAACQLQGLTRAQHLRLKPWDAVNVTREQLQLEYAKLINAAGEPQRREFLAVTRDGRRGWMELQRRAVRVDGRWLIISQIRNITERKLAEQMVVRHRRMYATLSDTNEAITHAGSAEELYQCVCNAAVRSGGMVTAAVLLRARDSDRMTIAAIGGDGKHLLHEVRISIDELAPEGRGLVGTAFRSGIAQASNDFLKDARTAYWHPQALQAGIKSSAAIPLMHDGHPQGVLLFYSSERRTFDDDVVKLLERMAENVSFALRALGREAAHRQLEAQFRESQKMEALGTLAGGVAHDFNNALAAILGNVELARQDVGPDHAALVSLEEIAKASRRAKDLVQQILAFGRRQTLERKAMSLGLVVVESARLLRASVPAAVTLTVECKGDTPAVFADETQVKQILLNLCGNALQAVQDQGRLGVIEVRLDAYTQSEALGDLRPGKYARLTVRDNGSGMDEATRSRIFEPFFTTKSTGQGTGLGLSVVHGIVNAHEASIEMESTLGEGSEFRIYFPAIDAPAPEIMAPTPDATPAHGKGKHVLYVDDEEAIIFLMTRLLERQGYRVSGYTDPHEAIAAVRANPDQFDLAVTDYNMPGMSGLEVAHALKTIRADLPVVLASGYITEELRQMAPAAGIAELIYKPNTVDQLCEAVARVAQTVGEKTNLP